MKEDQVVEMPWAEFLAQCPPDKIVRSADAVSDSIQGCSLMTPEIKMWCDKDDCSSMMLFESAEEYTIRLKPDDLNWKFVEYACKHCEESRKTFALLIAEDRARGWLFMKLGEFPAFGPVIPARVLRLVQSDVEHFKRGNQAERHGLGIAAFTYYRRVVENQKDRLFDRIISVSKKLGVSKDRLIELEKAKSDFQFTKSVADFKAAIPDALLINGHNPLTLLHKALSRGIHQDSDNDCLECARDIRLVLTELADRVAIALKEKGELDQAVSRLMQPRS